ncbi:MAG: low molecular weight phosphatase family protein [Sphingomonadaceae bacterium]
MIVARFGSARGAVRLGLSYLQVGARLAAIQSADPATITRLVFVCQGNICRSAFAEAVAIRRGAQTASFGLSTHTGGPAHPPAVAVASAMGYDLTSHRTTRVEDYEPLPGDLLLAMEVRQLHRLATLPRLAAQPRNLLGRWSGTPHLHDPFELDDAYMLTCLKRISIAVDRLVTAFPNARLSV